MTKRYEITKLHRLGRRSWVCRLQSRDGKAEAKAKTALGAYVNAFAQLRAIGTA